VVEQNETMSKITDTTLELASIVAANVTRRRIARGWSMGELAKASGVGKSTLSMIEAGSANPSMETLVHLSTALGVPFGDLVTAAGASLDVLRFGEGPQIESAGGSFRGQLLRSTGRRMTSELYSFVVEAGSVYEAEPHPLGVIETIVCTQGRIRVGPIDQPVVLKAGDRVTFAADVAHSYEAIRTRACVVLTLEYP
jgi:transcriptional regulator with XRE-family HTH domain